MSLKCPICGGTLYLPMEDDEYKCDQCGKYIEFNERHVDEWV